MLVLRSRVSRVDAVAFSPDGQFVAVAGTNGVELWETYQHKQVWRSEEPSGLRDMRKLHFGNDGWLIAIPQNGYEPRLYDVATGQFAELSFPYSDDRGLHYAWDASQFQLVAQSPHRLSCWRFERRKRVTKGDIPYKRVVVWDTVMASTDMGPMTFREVPAIDDEQPPQRELWTLTLGAWQVRDASSGTVKNLRRTTFTKPEEVLLTLDQKCLVGRQNAILLVWPLEYLKNPNRIEKENKRQLTGLALHPSGQYLATASNDRCVRLWDISTWQTLRAFEWKAGRMRSIAFSPDGLMAVAGGEGGEFVLFDVDL